MKQIRSGFFLLVCLLSLVACAHAADPVLAISAATDQNSVKAGMMFLTHVQVASANDDEVTFWANSCSYEKHWVTDSSQVFIQSWTCGENSLEEVTLKPGEVYEKNIILYIPKKDPASETVTFRVGFKRMLENGDVIEPQWSEPITLRVFAPEGHDASKPEPEQENAAAAKEEEPSPVSAPAAEAPAADTVPAGAYQDPAVPITAKVGEEFSIALASNPSTGYSWKMNYPEAEKIIGLLGSRHVVSDEVLPGVPGTQVYQFKALKTGEAKVDCVYRRAWETVGEETRKIFTVVVEEN